MGKKLIALMMALCMLFSTVVSIFAVEAETKTAVFLGDSLSLGFSMNGADTSAAFEYNRCLQQATNNYYWAYPFQFGELVYGKDTKLFEPSVSYPEDGNDYQVHNSIYNYGLSGAMAEDVDDLLWGRPLTDTGHVNVLRQGFIAAAGGTSADADKFASTLRERVKNADMVAVAVGGNNIYHNFIDSSMGYGQSSSFQASTEAGILGMIFSLISSVLQYTTPMTDLVSMLKMYADPSVLQSMWDMMNNPMPNYWGDMGGFGGNEVDLLVDAALQQVEESFFGTDTNPLLMDAVPETTGSSKTGSFVGNFVKGVIEKVVSLGKTMVNGGVQSQQEQEEEETPGDSSMFGNALEQFLNYYTKENIYNFYTSGDDESPYKIWEKGYDGIVNYLKENATGQIVLISQYNPFGLENYLTLMKERLADKSLWSDFGKESTTVLRVMRTLINELSSAQTYESTNRSTWAKLVSQAMKKAVNTLLPVIGQDTELHYYTYTTYDYGYPMSMTEGSALSLAEFQGLHPDAKETYLYYKGMGAYNMYTYMWDSTMPNIEASPKPPEDFIKRNNRNAKLIDADFRANPENADIVAYVESMYPSTKYIISDEDSSSLYDLLGEISYPMMIYLVGRGLQGVYDDMNEHIQELAANPFDNIVYVDISDAPTNGRFDPHPNKDGHTWIAKSIYEQLCMINGGTAFRGYRGEAEDGSNIDLTRVATRAIKTAAEAFIDLINGGGEAGVKGQWAAAITIMQQTQRISSLLLRQIL